ncbi:hypothetical protein Pmar_PMAR009966 [Perkinsus marinus ATCC 50983]|uniref:Uncharacterized protein n=1 Tax=Perkinsus marinus (strain ATCC 50983 / TXsc) TaxID=423536 RepID=C5L2Q9_PERM5|nr:hypothetical protein Pmar_PMAR009966 [Perkinsus marinus ATCC 50983]EER08974.1 hypothetical protein Pmar_PMAR009966 [Perkinsus marinus ATCC 50983]|eukprot:XP_002777158.1 hypothetical protein Pmar_PMAR009966 [Perkinsus marinus ATCC 50983]
MVEHLLQRRHLVQPVLLPAPRAGRPRKSVSLGTLERHPTDVDAQREMDNTTPLLIEDALPAVTETSDACPKSPISHEVYSHQDTSTVEPVTTTLQPIKRKANTKEGPRRSPSETILEPSVQRPKRAKRAPARFKDFVKL